MTNSPSWQAVSSVVDGLTLAFHRTGAGHGLPVLVLLHGITDDGLCWSRVAESFADGFDIVMPDARGHGRSGRLPGPLDNDRLAADVAGLLDAQQIPSALVWGHSMGALTALALASSRPDLVRGLVLEDPPLTGSAPPPELLDGIRAGTAQWSSVPAGQRLARAAEANPGWDAAELAPWVESKLAVDPAVTDSLGRLEAWDWRRGLVSLRCPGLLVTGEPGTAIVTPEIAQEVLALWPAGRLLNVAGAGHNIHRDRWTETTTAVRAFLGAVAG